MITIMLPAYNEADNLPPLLQKINDTMEPLGSAYNVLIVDDGSTDGTTEIIREFSETMPIQTILHPVNMGLAQTLRDGLKWASDHLDPDDILITLDADNTHEPYHIPDMLRRLDEGFDVVIASRYAPGGKEVGLTASRSLLSRSANVFLKICFPLARLQDYTCGFRAYRVSILQRAWEAYGDKLIQATTFAAMAEILINLRNIGMRVAEVPLVLRYDQKGGSSKMRVVQTTLNYFPVVWRSWWMQWSRPIRHLRKNAPSAP